MKKHYVALSILEGYGAEFVEAELKAQDAMSSDREPPESELLSMYEGVGVVEIKGKLTNRDSCFNSWFGLVSYNEIRAASVEALELGAQAILYDIDSPGGAVAGMGDVTNFIKGLQAPTVAHTSATMASAAYALGASCDSCLAGDMSEVGSVGVLMQHVDMTSALKKEGIKVDVIRSGKKKAVGGPYEKLSAENRKYLQDQVDTFAGKFYELVSEARGIPIPALGEITDGGTFIGEEAVQVGLVDKIMSFDDALLLTMGLTEKELDNSTNVGNNDSYISVFGNNMAEGGSVMPKKISKEALAALATAGNSTPVAGAVDNVEDLDVNVVAEDETVDADALDEDENDQEDTLDTQMLELQEQFDASQITLAENVETIAGLNEQITGLEAAHAKDLEAFSSVLIGQISTMRTALSLSAVDMTAFSAQAVLTEYNAVKETFEKSLVVGGVVPNEEGVAQETPKTSREDVSKLNSLGF